MLEERERLVELFGIMITEFKIGAVQIRILQVGFHGPHAATLIVEAGAAAPAALSAAVPPQLQQIGLGPMARSHRSAAGRA
jgi:hypothetical protein